MDTGPIINIADDQNAVTIKSASYTSSGLLLLFYIIIETLPIANDIEKAKFMPNAC
jgi:hypothetical protein